MNERYPDIAPLRLNLRHMTRDALASGATGFVMRVRLQNGGTRAIGRVREVAVQAELVHRFP